MSKIAIVEIYQQFLTMCIESNIVDIKTFYEANKSKINILYYDNKLIKILCAQGKLDILQWLYTIDNKIKFKIDDVILTRVNGKYDVLKWIFSVCKDLIPLLKYNNHSAFRTACKNNYIDIARFLQSINSKYNILVDNNVITEYWVTNDINLCVFYKTPGGLELKTLLNTQEIKIKNVDKLLEKINSLEMSNMTKSTYSKYGKTISDINLRNSVVSENIEILLENTDIIKQLVWGTDETTIDIHNNFNCIKYPVGGKFEWHNDIPQFINHNYTFLIYPPQSIEGGELVIKSSHTDKKIKKIKMSEHLWKIVMFPTGVLHASKEIISGTKITLKGTAFVKEKIKVFYKDSDSSEEAVDFSVSNAFDEDW